ncbi:MAG TPA: hypothetical protein VF487_13230 [Chitinophagaceae bacterium]
MSLLKMLSGNAGLKEMAMNQLKSMFEETTTAIVVIKNDVTGELEFLEYNEPVTILKKSVYEQLLKMSIQ